MPLSVWYCRQKGLPPSTGGIYPLPFDLILKWTSNTRIEEAVAMHAAWQIGLPVPRLIAYGSPGGDLHWGSILMTRIPGAPLSEVCESLSAEEEGTIKLELAGHLERMRAYGNPWGRRICSVAGTSLIGYQLPGGELDPCDNDTDFHSQFLDIGNNSRTVWEADEQQSSSFEETFATARKLLSVPHNITFTHGDLMMQNIMVSDGHITGILDWECAGWLPEYWEYTSAVRYQRDSLWWPQFMFSLPGYKYSDLLASQRALTMLAVYTFFY